MKHSEHHQVPITETIRLGPRGQRGILGWAFFDPANLVCVTCLSVSAVLVVLALRSRGAPDWYMPLGFYVCLAVFLRGYFFSYYHGSRFGRVTVMVILLLTLLASGAFWYERAAAHEVIYHQDVVSVEHSRALVFAALLHVLSAIALFVHLVLPRRWLIRFTDELADSAGRELAKDDPIHRESESADDEDD